MTWDNKLAKQEQDQRTYDNTREARRVSIINNDSGDSVSDTNPLPVELVGVEDSNNSTNTPLLTGQTFTGVATDVSNFAAITLLVHADVNSANDGLIVEYSSDASDWHPGEAYTIPAGTYKFFTPPVQAKYYRVKYTNNGTNQTEFHIHAMIKRTPIKWSSHNLNDNLNDDDDGELNLSVIKLRTAQNTYVSGAATASGNFKVSLEELESGISVNNNSQLKVTNYLANGNEGIQAADSNSIDAFGRWRSSNPNNRFDLEFIYDKQPLLVDEVTSGGATATHNTNTRDVTLDIVNATNGTSAALYSHNNIPYTPGNSQLVELTGTLDDSNIGGGTAYVFLRSNVTGSVVETVVEQASWDDPNLDIDWQDSQIFTIDFQSLKVGRIRFGLVRNGMFKNVHSLLNDNLTDSGYWQFPTQPIYWRIYNDATYTYMELGYGDDENAIGFRYRITANAAATMRAICSTVKSEGGQYIQDMPGIPFSVDNGVTKKTVSTTLVPVLSIRPKSTFNSKTNRMLFVPESFELESNNPIKFVILYRPTLTGASFVSVDANSGVEYDTSATVVSNGCPVYSGYLSTARNINTGTDTVLSKIILSLGRTGTSDILTIAAVRTGTNDGSVLSSVHWKEIR